MMHPSGTSSSPAYDLPECSREIAKKFAAEELSTIVPENQRTSARIHAWLKRPETTYLVWFLDETATTSGRGCQPTQELISGLALSYALYLGASKNNVSFWSDMVAEESGGNKQTCPKG